MATRKMDTVIEVIVKSNFFVLLEVRWLLFEVFFCPQVAI